MSNFTTNSDLVQDALFRAGEPADGTSDFHDAAFRYLNAAYQSLWTGGGEFAPGANESWWWLRESGVIHTAASYSEGTITLTNGSDSFTLSEAPSSTLAGYHLKVDDHPDVYVIDTHSGTSGTLDHDWMGDSVSGGAFRAFKIDYTLENDVIRLISPMMIQQGRSRLVNLWGFPEFSSRWPLSEISNANPTAFTMLDEDEVRFNAVPDDPVRIDYEYLVSPPELVESMGEVPFGEDTPRVPKQYRKVLADIVCMKVLADKNDSRAGFLQQTVRAGVQAMVIENRRRWGNQSREMAIRPRRTGRRHRKVTTDSGLEF